MQINQCPKNALDNTKHQFWLRHQSQQFKLSTRCFSNNCLNKLSYSCWIRLSFCKLNKHILCSFKIDSRCFVNSLFSNFRFGVTVVKKAGSANKLWFYVTHCDEPTNSISYVFEKSSTIANWTLKLKAFELIGFVLACSISCRNGKGNYYEAATIAVVRLFNAMRDAIY